MAYVYSSSSNMNAQAMEDKAERMLGIMGYCASQSMSSMGFTKTIEAEVLGVANAIKNTYRLRYQNAVGVGLCAIEKLKTSQSVKSCDLQPRYLRLPQAERELNNKGKRKNV